MRRGRSELTILLVLSGVLTGRADTDRSAGLRESYGRLPLHFESNQGQTDARVKFLARGPGYSLFLTPSEAVLALRESEPVGRGDVSRVERGATGSKARAAVVRMALVGANPRAHVRGRDALPGRSSYFLGNDPAKWRRNVIHFARVHLEDVYPGIDLIYYGNQGQLEYDFVLAPGANPDLITLGFEGVDDVRVDARGELVLQVDGGGELRQHKPVVYQEAGGVRQAVAGRYVMKPKGQVGFQIAEHDSARPLIIDPVLIYSTYLGGSSDDSGQAIAVDSAGSAYVAGYTFSTDFPTTAGAAQAANAGGFDAFVTKLDATGSTLVYSTYLGGSSNDSGYDIALDGAGNAYVTGETSSADFPTTAGAAQTAKAGGFDTFVTKLDATGSALVYSTYLGGSDTDGGVFVGIAVDGTGSAYVAGITRSTDFPTTLAYQTANAGALDAFVTKLDPTGSLLVYSTYLGGSGDDFGGASIAVDAVGSAYVAGNTQSTDFPTSAGAFQTTYAGGFADTFVTKLDAIGSGLIYSTYLGGSNSEIAYGIAVDTSGGAYVTGNTVSTSFPTTAGAAQMANAGGLDAFVTKLNAAGSALAYSTYLGGSGNDGDLGVDIAVDGAGNAHVTSGTGSTDFPTTAGAVQTTNAGGVDVFVTKLDATGSTLAYSTYLGASGGDRGIGIALDAAGIAYVTGETSSTDFPTTAAAAQTTYAGGFLDAFIAQILPVALPTTAGQCRNGGWKTFGVFRNQGDCVSFVSTGGRNPPANLP